MPVFTLPKSSHPDFALPNVKPTGPVDIDRSESITIGLDAYGLDLVDLVNNNPEDYYSNRADQIADYLHFNDTRNGEAIIVDGLGVDYFDGKTEFSIAICARFHGTASAAEDSIFGQLASLQGDSGQNSRCLCRYDSNNTGLDWFIDDGATQSINTDTEYDLDDGKFHTIIGMLRGGVLKINVDGITNSASDVCGAVNSTAETKYPEIMGGHEVTINGGDSPRFDLKWWGFWGRGLSDGECWDLHHLPYRSILKPAIPLTYFVPGAAAAGGRTAISLAHYGGLAAYGGLAGKHGGLAG